MKFVVDGVTLATVFSAPYSAKAKGLSRAEHVVEVYLVDGSGNPIAGQTTYDKATPVGIGEIYVAIGDGITYGLGDDTGADDNSADGRNMLGGFTSILADALTAARGYPFSVVNEGITGTSSINGVKSIKFALQNYPAATAFLIMYGHNDAALQLPSGLGLLPGDPGYAGSFKDYMQRIVNKVRNAGKVPLLAKHPAALPLDGPIDVTLLEYNLVIEQLAADPNNGVTVAPPDLSTISGPTRTLFSRLKLNRTASGIKRWLSSGARRSHHKRITRASKAGVVPAACSLYLRRTITNTIAMLTRLVWHASHGIFGRFDILVSAFLMLVD